MINVKQYHVWKQLNEVSFLQLSFSILCPKNVTAKIFIKINVHDFPHTCILAIDNASWVENTTNLLFLILSSRLLRSDIQLLTMYVCIYIQFIILIQDFSHIIKSKWYNKEWNRHGLYSFTLVSYLAIFKNNIRILTWSEMPSTTLFIKS